MAYATTNPPRLFSQSVGSSYGAVYYYSSTDALATVLGTDYFSNGHDLGMRVNDVVIFVDETLGQTKNLFVSASTSGGAATVTGASTDLNTAGVVSGTGATATLTAAQSGKKILFDRAAGIVFTLPAPVVGLKYSFITTVDLTSNAYAVNTSGSSVFLVGAVFGAIEGAATGECHFANGTTHVGISSNKTTTGGLIGGWLEFECISATVWEVKGTLSCTATPATPFTT